MIKIENTDVCGWEHAIRGMRNPMNSWDKSDSDFVEVFEDIIDRDVYSLKSVNIGENDFTLMKTLAKKGSVHAKYRRMIVVYADIVAPLYWWKEFETYKVGTVVNSCSTMHKIADKEFTLDDFSCEYLVKENIHELNNVICKLNKYREKYLNWNEHDLYIDDDTQIVDKKVVWWQMIQLLPSSYNQRRTVMLNYEVLSNVYRNRKEHKLDEWREFCKWIETLPYSEIITGYTEVENDD